MTLILFIETITRSSLTFMSNKKDQKTIQDILNQISWSSMVKLNFFGAKSDKNRRFPHQALLFNASIANSNRKFS